MCHRPPLPRVAHPLGRKGALGQSGGGTGENGEEGRVGKVENEDVLRGRAVAARRSRRVGVGA